MNIKIILLKWVYHSLIRAMDGFFLNDNLYPVYHFKKIYSQSSLHEFTDKHGFKPQIKFVINNYQYWYPC